MLALFVSASLAMSGPRITLEADDPAEFAAKTPEEAIRAFILALSATDATLLKTVALPTDDLGLLLRGRKPSSPEEARGLRARIGTMPIRFLKAGEDVTMPDGRVYKARAEDVTPESAVALPERATFPVVCRKVDGRWRIDAAPILARIKPPPRPKPIDPGPIQEKIAIGVGQTLDVAFAIKAGEISAPRIVAKPNEDAPTVHLDFARQDDGGLWLTTQNPFPKNLTFRAIARHKGRKEYFETSIVPVGARIFSIEMWREPIEELVLFDFKLVEPKL